MLGFAIVDRQPTAEATAVWLTSRIDDPADRRKDDSGEPKGVRANHTNAVVISHDDDRHDAKVRSLTTDRVVVLTDGTTPPLPFVNTLGVEVFDRLIEVTRAHQQRISDAVAAARTPKRKLSDPDFPMAIPHLVTDQRDEPAYRALSVANYVARVWEAWLATDAHRARRSIPTGTKTGELPPIMPQELCDPAITELPPEFAALATPEPVS
ncbi:hypothetical protein [Mycobacterium sp.]|uniref:hypothetical protein n=1 Tax=Mycobacterium sp. TaxID=1785 RepID=UPI003A87871A